MNFTILSLSLSSVYSFSPLFVRNDHFIEKSHFKFFNFPLFFLNPKYLQIDRCLFTKGIGSLLYSENSDTTIEISEEKFDQNNQGDLPSDLRDQSTTKRLLIIRDCIFTLLTGTTYLIQQENEKATFYMTSCTFQNCNYNSGIQKAKSRATTYSHICISDTNHNYDEKLEGAIIDSQTPVNSFFNIFYSTVVGDGQELSANSIIRLNGQCSMRYQCMNVSNFKLKFREDAYVSIVKFMSQICLNMMMNTFYKSDSKFLININPQNGYTGYRHYMSLCNFFDNKFTYIFEIDFNQGTHACIDGCVFKNPRETRNNKIFHFDRKPTDCSIRIDNCVFEVNYDIDGDLEHLTTYTSGNKVLSNPETINLAHFIVTEICNGIPNNDAFGCKNGNCPDNKGCDTDAFDFKTDDVEYTEKYHPDVDTPTPTPTGYFSKSSFFTQSNGFSSSFFFSESMEFSPSDDQNKTTVFSKSSFFSNSQKFTKSDEFSKSSSFNENVPPIVIDRDESNSDNKLKPGAIAGIAVAAVALAAIIAFLVFFFIRKRKLSLPDEDVETIDNSLSSTKNDNPIYDNKGSDDPFKEDFNN